MYLKLIFCLIFLLPHTSFSQDEPSTEEVETYLEAIKEVADEKQILSSEQFKKCKEQNEGDKEKIYTCMEITFGKLSEEETKKLSENLGLTSFNKKAAKNTKTVKEYLQTRLRKGIYGEDPDVRKKFEDRTFVSHDAFYQLYKEQIGKNSLLIVSDYCISNLYVEDKFKFHLYGTDPDMSMLIDVFDNPGSVSKYYENNENNFKIKALVTDPSKTKDDITANGAPFSSIGTDFSPSGSNFFTEFGEANVCVLNDKDKCKAKYGSEEKYKSLALIEKLKDVEFLLAQNNKFGSKLIADRYKFCATKINQICEYYKCNNIYDETSPEKVKKKCSDDFRVTVQSQSASGGSSNASISLTSAPNKIKGSIACNVAGRLNEYREMILATKDIEKSNEPFRVRSGFSGSFGNVFDARKINELTSIKSTDLGAKITGLEQFGEDIVEACLRDDPANNERKIPKDDALENPKCQQLIANITGETIDAIELDTAGKTAAELKNIRAEDLKAGTREYEEFKNKHGLTDTDMENTEKVKALLQQDFKAKKKALIAALNKKYINEKKLGQDKETQQYKDDEKKVFEDTVEDLQQHKRRVETLFEYSNIVSSYLEVTSGEGDNIERSQNTTPRNVELVGVNEEDPDDPKSFFVNGDDQGSSGGASNLEYDSALGQILGVVKNKDNE